MGADPLTVTLVPSVEKVRLRTLTATDGGVYVGVELEYRTPDDGEPSRLQFGLDPEDAVRLAGQLAQLGEKLQSTEH